MKALYVHAHFDDYEFTAAGTFDRWRALHGDDFKARVIVCTDGAAGHHFRSREETARVRLAEQLAAGRLGGVEFELLRLPDGRVPRETRLRHEPGLVPALWEAVRRFEPDYLFCPPLPADPLAGVHVDHLDVAQAVRDVAYLINVPHCFTPEYPTEGTPPVSKRTPVIIAVYDGYMFGENVFDFAVDIEPSFDRVVEMAWCHQSQICEWLPWVGRHRMEPPHDLADWRTTLRQRFDRKNRELALSPGPAHEVFTVTAWGEIPTLDQLRHDLPAFQLPDSRPDALARKLRRWRGEA